MGVQGKAKGSSMLKLTKMAMIRIGSPIFHVFLPCIHAHSTSYPVLSCTSRVCTHPDLCKHVLQDTDHTMCYLALSSAVRKPWDWHHDLQVLFAAHEQDSRDTALELVSLLAS